MPGRAGAADPKAKGVKLGRKRRRDVDDQVQCQRGDDF
jgi:hypothetical protein